MVTARSLDMTFMVNRTLQRDVLNFTDLGVNSNKFYVMELQEGSGQYSYCIHTTYGRVGKNPKQEGRYFNSQYEAQAEYNKIFRAKTRKYHKIEVEDGYSPFSSQGTVSVRRKTNNIDLSQVNDKVLRMIGRLYEDATSYIAKSIQTPLGKLSANQVAKGLEILATIESMLNGKDGISQHQFERLSNQFYSVIPVEFGGKIDYHKALINDFTKLNDRKDLLGVMQSIVTVQDSLEKKLEDKYKALNIKLKALTSNQKEYKRISDKVHGSKSRHHRFGIDIQDIYLVEDMTGHDSFNPYKVETMEFFHGSRNENILSIMQNSLKIKPASAKHTGSMFGSAIYFAPDVTKSANYCWGFGHDVQEIHYLFVCEVATGRVKDFDSAQPNLTSAPRGYNSVRGVKGNQLLHDEYMVYRDNQVKVTHVIEFKKR